LQLAAALFFAQESRSSVSFLTADSRLADAAEIEGLCVMR
jgi:predicted nucleic acid-binding protein